MQPDYRLSIAPMMAYTDRHYRYMVRQFTRRTLLYTEMVVGTTISYNLNNKRVLDRVLGFHPVEHPVAVQLGGDDAGVLALAAKVCEDYGYDEINLNIGCPSDKVQKGRFGVCLMKEPAHVASLVEAMRHAVAIPVTVKHRIGVDDQEDYSFLHRFVAQVSETGGADVFAVHARKAWLKGLSPAQNRSVPPLDYGKVYRLKQDFPHLKVVINGGIQDLNEAENHLNHVDGVMIGRAAYQHPEMFCAADERIFGEPHQQPPTAEAMIDTMNHYLHAEIAKGARISWIAKHLVGLFKNRPNARKWRQSITHLIQENPSEFDLNQLYRNTIGVTLVS